MQVFEMFWFSNADTFKSYLSNIAKPVDFTWDWDYEKLRQNGVPIFAKFRTHHSNYILKLFFGTTKTQANLEKLSSLQIKDYWLAKITSYDLPEDLIHDVFTPCLHTMSSPAWYRNKTSTFHLELFSELILRTKAFN